MKRWAIIDNFLYTTVGASWGGGYTHGRQKGLFGTLSGSAKALSKHTSALGRCGLQRYNFYRSTRIASILVGRWPSGRYCILANGHCPSGFSKYHGYMRAISLYSGSSDYIKQVTFGSSKIQCHGWCGEFGHWIGDLYITACCKWQDYTRQRLIYSILEKNRSMKIICMDLYWK